MTRNDYTEIINFFGKEETCFVVLRKLVGKERFSEIVRLTDGNGMTKFLGDVTDTGSVYFIMKRPKSAHINCILIRVEDYPCELSADYAKIITKSSVVARMEKNIIQSKSSKPKKEKATKKYSTAHLKQLSYDEFLRTDYWKEVRQEKLRQCGHKCQICGSTTKLHIHHNSYRHHGNEAEHLEDLIVLCEKCHALFHQKLKVTE